MIFQLSIEVYMLHKSDTVGTDVNMIIHWMMTIIHLM